MTYRGNPLFALIGAEIDSVIEEAATRKARRAARVSVRAIA